MLGRTVHAAKLDVETDEGGDVTCVPPGLVEYARHLIRVRHEMEQCLPQHIVRDCAWDILLGLFVEKAEKRNTCVKQALLMSSRSTTSTLRLIERLEAEGLVARTRDEADHRRMIIHLTQQGHASLAMLLGRMANYRQGVAEVRTV